MRSAYTEAQRAEWRSTVPLGDACLWRQDSTDKLEAIHNFLRAWADEAGGTLPPLAFVAATLGARKFRGNGVSGAIRINWLKCELVKLGIPSSEGLR